MNTIELNPSHLWLGIEPEQINSAEQKVENIDTYQYQSYLNQLASDIVFPYIQEEYPQASITKFDYSQFWQFGVNGVSIDFDGKRLILVPSDDYDIDELRISQEWVDIPDLAADYYLAVQVDIGDGLMRIWGYTTHKELKETGTYCDRDRTYSITREQLTEDINALWLMRSYFPDKETKTAIVPIPELSESEQEQILDRLVNPEIRLLRRSISFPQWAYIFNSKKLRTELSVNRLIHLTLVTFISGTSEEKISEIRDKKFTNKELAAVAEGLNKIYCDNEDEYILFSDGEEALRKAMSSETEEELATTRRGDDIRVRGGKIELDEDDEYLEGEPDLLDLVEDLFNKLKAIWADNDSNK